MIQASELRIGNYVNVPRKDQSPFRIDAFEYLSNKDGKVAMGNGTCYVEGFGVVPNHELTWDLKDLEPIPITYEILEKCGIERTGNLAKSATRIFYRIGKIILESAPENRFVVYFDALADQPRICFLDYLHQLQNLYYSLTQEELKVNL